ncbi:tetratricopeptide repeat protein [Sediminicoccus sp. KRV36]|uniref:tetratricopeptide repeat protein n=1 Tax=Sediminicoccus sp. KRV36 TaxID=3133721 RepID=UPI00200F2342|nr:tetratricopeptide repeat protein [Sediminicoccus rosea]UPY39053.1 tetratricopeptide repeat protein [Sediminicoccus rosea]
MRKSLLIFVGLALAAAAGGAVWFQRAPAPETQRATSIPTLDNLPLPPELPRIADGPEYDRCLSLLRDDPDEAMRFAQAWDATGGGDGARHCIALAMLGLGEPDRAADRLERLGNSTRAGGVARAAVFGQASQAWMMAGDPNRAFAAATIALTLAPQDVELLVDRSVVLAAMQRYRESIEDLDSALALEPERAEAWVLRAAALRHLERVDQAFLAVERALVLAPENAEALLERGILRQLRGDVAGARNDWQRAIQLAPDTMAADLAAQNIQLNELGPQRR